MTQQQYEVKSLVEELKHVRGRIAELEARVVQSRDALQHVTGPYCKKLGVDISSLDKFPSGQLTEHSYCPYGAHGYFLEAYWYQQALAEEKP